MTDSLRSSDPDTDAPLRILIVCEQPLVGRGLQIALAAEPRLDVIPEVVHHRDAVPAMLRLQPELVLLDLSRTVGGTAALIRKVHEGAGNAPVLVLAERDDDDAVLQSLKAGARGYLTYDIGMERLVEVIVDVGSGATGLTSRRLSRLVRRLVEGEQETPSLVRFLTAREQQVLTRLTQGRSNREIADELSISINTTRTHVQNILSKLGVHSKLEAAAYAVQHGTD